MLVDKVEELLTEVRLLQQQDTTDARKYRWLLNFITHATLQRGMVTILVPGYQLDEFITRSLENGTKIRS